MLHKNASWEVWLILEVDLSHYLPHPMGNHIVRSFITGMVIVSVKGTNIIMLDLQQGFKRPSGSLWGQGCKQRLDLFCGWNCDGRLTACETPSSNLFWDRESSRISKSEDYKLPLVCFLVALSF